MTLLLLALLGCGTSTPPEAPAEGAKGAKAAARARAMRTPKGAASPSTPAAKPPAPDAPNVLLVVWDTVRADRMSVYGYDKPTTPRMEAWAKKSALVYDRPVSPGVWTLPSHASLFTALPVRVHGVNADTKYLEDRFVTVAEALSEVGYDTYTFCSNPYLAPETNLLQGFDTRDHPWEKPWRKKVQAWMDSKLLPDDASSAVSPMWQGKGGAGQNKYLFKESGPVAQEAFLGWLDDRAEPDRPWFAFINYMEAHLPRIPTEGARKQVMTPEEMRTALTVPQTTTHFHEWMTGVREYSDIELASISSLYDASLIDLDKATGDLFDALEARGLAENTIVVLTSDHGENLGDHDLLLHKYAVYNTLTRVPLIVSWPNHIAGRREAAPKSVADILADVVELGDIPVNAPVRKGLAQRDSVKAEGVVAEFSAVATGSLERMLRLHPTADLKAFERTFESIELGPHKYISASNGDVELFDVLADPHETKDLSDQVELRSRLEAALVAWRETVRPFEKGAVPEGAGEMNDELREGLEALGYVE